MECCGRRVTSGQQHPSLPLLKAGNTAGSLQVWTDTIPLQFHLELPKPFLTLCHIVPTLMTDSAFIPSTPMTSYQAQLISSLRCYTRLVIGCCSGLSCVQAPTTTTTTSHLWMEWRNQVCPEAAISWTDSMTLWRHNHPKPTRLDDYCVCLRPSTTCLPRQHLTISKEQHVPVSSDYL